jgi:hypothetical protein
VWTEFYFVASWCVAKCTNFFCIISCHCESGTVMWEHWWEII